MIPKANGILRGFERWVGIAGLVALLSCVDAPDPVVDEGARPEATPSDVPEELRPEQIAALVSPAVVLLIMEDANSQPVTLGSGFVIAPGVIATNYHVIAGAAQGRARFVGASDFIRLESTRATDPQRDIALVTLPQAIGPDLSLASGPAPEVGSQVFVVSNPQGFEGTFSEGIISGRRIFGGDSVLQITAPISPGSSGGPVVDDRGEVIGVATATVASGQNLNFAIPVRYLAQLRASPEQTRPFSSLPRNASSVFDALGRPSREGVTASEFLWNSAITLDIAFITHGAYTFSLRNELDQAIRNVRCLVVFNDSEGRPLDVDEIVSLQVIRPGLAARISGKVHDSVQSLTTADGSRRPRRGRVEIRILSFDFAP